MPLLTVDIWDTLLRRRCHPDEVKLFVARYLWLKHRPRLRPPHDTPWALFELRRACEAQIGQRTRAAGFDDEYGIADVLATWIAAAFSDPLPAPQRDALVQELLEVEVAQECRMAVPDSQIQTVLASYGDLRPVLVSDFYLGAAHLTRILRHAYPTLEPRAIYVSCDVGWNKRSGRLFEHVYRELHAAPQTHVHVGDHPHSDVAVPRRLGAQAVHYSNPPSERLRRRREHCFARRTETLEPYVRDLRAQLAAAVPGSAPRAQLPAGLFELGRSHALLFYAFVLFCIEQATQAGAERVYYFTREGVFFRRLHEHIRTAAPLGILIPPGELLEVSRLATFLPSLREFTPHEFMRIWNLYSTQSVGALCATLGLDATQFERFWTRHGLNPEEPIRYPWQDPRVLALLADDELRDLWDAIRQQRRARLLRYLAAHGITPDQRRLFIVDIGWRGTIQDNLAYLLPDVHVHGVYFALKQLLNEQPSNVDKVAFGPDENRDAPVKTLSIHHVAPLEMLTNCPGGSVRAYEDTPAGAVATRDANPGEDAVHAGFTQHFQQCVLSAAPVLSEWVRTHAFTAQELRPHALGMLRELICDPPRPLVQAYFALHHNEQFGLGRYVGKQQRFPYGLAVLGLVSRARRSAFVRFLDATGWPQGFLRYHGLGPLCRVYNRAVETRRARSSA